MHGSGGGGDTRARIMIQDIYVRHQLQVKAGKDRESSIDKRSLMLKANIAACFILSAKYRDILDKGMFGMCM